MCSLATWTRDLWWRNDDVIWGPVQHIVQLEAVCDLKQFHFSAQSLLGNYHHHMGDVMMTSLPHDESISLKCVYKMSNEFGHFASGSLKSDIAEIYKILFS